MFQRKSIIVFALCTILSVSAVYETASAESDCGDGVICTLTGKFKSLETLEILPPDPKWIFSMVDGNTANPHFSYVRAQVRITAPGVTAGSGELVAYAIYRERIDFDINLATDPPTAASRADQYSYVQSYPYPVTNLDASLQEFVFNFSGAPIPVGITDLYFGVFLRGQDTNGNFLMLYGTIDLNEPMHFVTFNTTDFIYCQGTLYTAQEYTDAGLWETCMVGDIDPVTDLGAGTAFFENFDNLPAFYNTFSFNMPAPSYSRLILLFKGSETAILQSFYSNRLKPDGTPFYSIAEIISGVVNQEQGGGAFQSTGILEFRGIRYHMASAAIVGSQAFVSIKDAAWPSLGDNHKTSINISE